LNLGVNNTQPQNHMRNGKILILILMCIHTITHRV